ncbi:hypothetical protein AVEN_91278-1 [Araneus ventricosus]|uniref:Uncharacterized protein n=1 Tax=Araneus ventricosus TaxID=182803 RepID=A0A4Y2ETC0_ARAVE|nr:hypothetical protein AVEN_91278-1 [Araneus ventricosus]
MEPSSVNINNQAKVWQNLYGDLSKQKSEKPSFKVGDKVRISEWKGRFEKGYENNWSRAEVLNLWYAYPWGYAKDQLGVREFKIEGRWEVGLAEIICPQTWYNVNVKNNIFGFDLGDGKLIARKIPPGSYETVPDILKAMVLLSHEGKITFKFNANNKRVEIKTEKNTKVVLQGGLWDFLGFQPHVVEGVEESSFVTDPQSAFPVFYMYSDIVQPVVVGHVEAPLLRVVRISGKDGDVVGAHYNRPHYTPVIRQSFRTIEIKLRLNSGSLVPIERGKVIIVLHFRMRQIL